MSLTPYQFRFTGTTSGYYRTWLINTALILVTGGAYYAWAKVRSKRYFHAHTTVAKTALEYHGSAIDIFKGWVLATLFSAAAYVAVIMAWENALPFAAALIFLLPWIIVSALRYRARHSSFQGIRFDFTGGMEEALVVYTLLPALCLVTAGLALPYLCYRHRKFVVENHWFGGWQFSFRGKPGDYYFTGIVALLIIGAGVGGGWGLYQYGQQASAYSYLMPLAASATAGLFVVLGVAWFIAGTANLGFNTMTLQNSNFKSRLSGGRLFIMYLVNLLALTASAGLLMPWVKIRMAKYRAQSLQFIAVRSVEKLLPQVPKRSVEDAGALGEVLALEFGL